MSYPAPITVIIPTYNYSHLLPRAISSVLAQSVPVAELIVVDDGSTDLTADLMQTWVDRSEATSTRIYYLHQTNRGAGAARNHGVRLASQAWVLFLDADDELLPDAIACYVKTLSQHPNAELFFARSRTLTHKHVIQESQLFTFHPDKQRNVSDFLLHKKFSASTSGRLLLKTDVAKTFPYPENIRHGEDIALVALLLANVDCYSLPDIVVTVHSHAESLRHQHLQALPDMITVVDTIFNSPQFPPALYHLRQDYLIRRLFSQANTYLKMRESKKTRLCLKEINRIKPYAWLHFKWLKKYIKSFLI